MGNCPYSKIVGHRMGLMGTPRVARVYEVICSQPVRTNDKQHLVHLPLTNLLKKSVNYKVQWLEVAELVLQEGRRLSWYRRHRMDHMVIGMRKCMFSWLMK
jgi:hypothetical protein